MITSSTNWFTVHPTELQGDRLDFVYQHPALEDIRQFRRSPKVQPLGPLITTPEYGLSQSGQPEGLVGFLNVQHITVHGQIVFQPETYLPGCPQGKLLRVDDILIARTGHTLGKAARITELFNDYTFGSFCLRFRTLANEPYSTSFIVHFINSQWGQRQILMLKTGAGKYNLNRDQVADIHIPILGLHTQQRLLEPLLTAEMQALTMEQGAATSRHAADTLLRDRLGVPLGDLDNEDYFFKRGGEHRSLAFWILPNEMADRLHYLAYHPRLATLEHLRSRYSVTTLGAIAAQSIVRGDQPSYESEGTTVIKTVDLKNGYIDYDNALTVSDEFFANYAEAHPEGVLRRNDILIASTGYVSMGKVDIYDRDEPALADGHISIVRVNPEEYDPCFLAYFLRSHLGQLQFEAGFTGSSGQIEIQPGDLGRLLVPDNSQAGVPIEEQRGLAAAVTPHIDQAYELERQARERRQEAQEIFGRAIVDQVQ